MCVCENMLKYRSRRHILYEMHHNVEIKKETIARKTTSERWRPPPIKHRIHLMSFHMMTKTQLSTEFYGLELIMKIFDQSL